MAPKDARALSKVSFDRLHVLEEGTHEYQYARNTLIAVPDARLALADPNADRTPRGMPAQDCVLVPRLHVRQRFPRRGQPLCGTALGDAG